MPTVSSDQRGTVFVEYALVLSLLVVGAALAITLLAALLTRVFIFQQALLLLPFP